MQKRILSLLVDNNAGVLSRVSGLFSRRGYNIDSLTVGVTADPRFSRMTIVCNGDEQILEQITKQLAKLIDVRNIKVLDPDNSVKRELVLLKISARPDQRQGIISIADIFRAKVVDVSKESLIIEMTGSKSKLKAFIELLDEYEILELARTGLTGLSRGSDDVTFL
jgi:acetolactate synthase-1/3 small subunit